MKYVLDSSVALKWVLQEAASGRAIRLLDEYAKSIHDLVAPDIFMCEVANVLAVTERQGRINQGEAAIFFLDITRQSPLIHATYPLLPRAMEISIVTRQAVYDCVYVALAELEQCELVTADDLLVRNLRATFPFLIRLADLP
ncbi:MAG: type II toxin-antitoxin system VapC family toxin [Planctomycetes bacterium]|nr:type II toxin-antitoxin system VapC family toxin [Planctomycetota bacterium]